MKKVELSKRMQAVSDLVTKGNRVCDVGCDHGYVSIYLVQTKAAPAVLAMDVNQGPLLGAKEHILQYGAEDYITLRLSDGLCGYQLGEADSLVCAGMGGRLLYHILSKEPAKTCDFKELILQPQSEIALFRKWLRENGFLIAEENMIWEDDKFYPMMKVMPPQDAGDGFSDFDAEGGGLLFEDRFGPVLLREKHPVLKEFVSRELKLKQKILEGMPEESAGEKTVKRKSELTEEIRILEEALFQLNSL